MSFNRLRFTGSVKSALALATSFSLLASPIGLSVNWADSLSETAINPQNTAYTPTPKPEPRMVTWEQGPSLMRYFSKSDPTYTSTENPEPATAFDEDEATPKAASTKAATSTALAKGVTNEPVKGDVTATKTPPQEPSVMRYFSAEDMGSDTPPTQPAHANITSPQPEAALTLRPAPTEQIEQPVVSPQPIAQVQPTQPVPPTKNLDAPTYQAESHAIANMPPYQWHNTSPSNALDREQATAMLFAQPSEPVMDNLREPNILESVISSSSTQVELTKNKALLLNLNMPISRATISNSDIAKAVALSPTQIQLVGINLGSANLILWPTGGFEQQVVDIAVHEDLTAIRSQLKSINNSFTLTSAQGDKTMMLTGQTDRAEEAQLAKELTRSFFVASGNGQEATNVINLIRINGRSSTKLSLVQDKLSQIDPNIHLDMVPGPDGKDKAVLTGMVPSADVVSKAINTASIFYGEPGLKVITGPGGNAVNGQANESFHSGDAFSSNVAINVLQGSIITDTSGNVVSMLRVAERPQVRCTIQFLEISRNDLNQLGSSVQGISGNTGYANLIGRQSSARSFSSINSAASTATWSVAPNNTQTTTSAFAQTLADGATQVFTLGSRGSLYLSALVEKRQVRSLAEPTLTMLSGEKASFLAGGEVPVPVSLLNGQISVSFKDFGIRLNLIPTVVEDDLIHLQVAPEVSTVDTTIFVNAGGLNIPGFRTRRMQTTLEMQDGEQLVLAGLYNTEDIRTISRTPVLGNVPILGAFFRSKSRDKDKNEMIVIIRPEIIRTAVNQSVNDGEWSSMRSKLEDTMDASKAEQDENVSKHLLPYVQGKGN